MLSFIVFFFFTGTATTGIYTYRHPLSLHDALPIFFASTSALAAELAPLDKVQSRTADALGLETGDFTVSDLEKDGVATRYRVTTNSGEKYSCYVTSTS